MFDLNIEMETNNNNNNNNSNNKEIPVVLLNNNEHHEDVEEEDKEGSGTNTELSGTSSASSVVNNIAYAAATESTTPRGFELFCPNEYVTRQLFPMSQQPVDDSVVAGVGDNKDMELIRVGSSQPGGSTTNNNNHQWLNLAVAGSGSGSGFGSDQQENNNNNNNKQQVRRSRRGPRSRSSQYRGVTFYRRTGRWESHIWDCGKQVYLGGFDTAHAAARAYDRAAIKFRGVDADINFNITDYEEDMKQTKNLNKEEFVHILRRQSNGFSRGSSRYRGVTLHKCGRWEARMGQFLGKKAYDKAAIQCNGRDAVTNFEPGSYEAQLLMQANNNGGGDHEHNLDLNLGISSTTTDGPKASNMMRAGESQIHHSPLQLVNGKMPMNGSSSYFPSGPESLYGVPLALSRQSATAASTWSGLPPPGRSGTYEEKVGDRKGEVTSSSRPSSSWAWYAQNQGQGGGRGGGGSNTTNPIQQVLSNADAASSGFSFSTTTSPSSSSTFHYIFGPDR